MNEKDKIPEVIYHYCSTSAFLDIIASKSIWLTNAMETNDIQERKLIDPFIEKHIIEYSNKGKNGKTFINSISQNFRLNREIPVYLSSFSTKEDSLSQWRGYAQDGAGFAIGFDPSYFKFETHVPFTSAVPDHTVGIFEIEYNSKKVERYVSDIIASAWLRFEEQKFSEQSDAMMLCSSILVRLASMCKNPSFEEEKEWRVLYAPIISKKSDGSDQITGKIQKRRFYKRNDNIISSYFPITFADSSGRMPIKTVYLGPKNKSDIGTIRSFLFENTFKNVYVERSKSSYR